jgi:NTE family protein
MNKNRLLALTLTLVSFGISAQPYTNLVFEGGGIRGIAYTGALRTLEEQRILPQIKRVAGTSAGAIAALTVSLRYTPADIEKIIYDTKLQKFNDGKFFFIGGINRMNQKYGWYRGEAFSKWLAEIIRAKTGNADITFLELHNLGYPDLYVTGTSLNRQKLIIFSFEEYPEMKIKDAVRISMSIPLYFEAVCIDSAGRVQDIRGAKGNYDIMVDGGFTGNFPIAVFDTLQTTAGETIRKPNTATIGLRLDSDDQIAYDREQKGLAPVDIEKFREYMGAFYSYVIENLNRSTLTPDDWKRTVSISTGGIGPKIRKLTPQEKETLINNGKNGMMNFLKSHE